MQKLFSAKQIKRADQFTIEHEPITSIDLMERAANTAFSWILGFAKKQSLKKVALFCGTGNNGGDGLAIARMLLEAQFKIDVYILEIGQYSADFQENLNRLNISPNFLNEKNFSFQLSKECLVIDAIFGTGLNRKVGGFAAQVIAQINRFGNKCVAIDIPSGLQSEVNEGLREAEVIQADYTLSFQFPKLSFMFPETQPYIGNVIVLNIGLSEDFISVEQTNYYQLTKESIADLVKKRAANAHKGTFGHACLIAGSEGKIGAAVLASKACLRAGVGLLTVRLPSIGQEIMQLSVPEAMVEKDENLAELKNTFRLDKYSALGVGPGIGTSTTTIAFFEELLKATAKPMVIDADALNIISLNKALLNAIPKGSIITPHPGEFERLVGSWENDFQRLQLQLELAEKHEILVILKGNNTSVALPKGAIYFNSTGNPGMATGGSGDVLTGILTGLLAQGYSAEEACLLGVYIHGLAGDYAAEIHGHESMIASDIIACLSKGFHALKVI